MEDRATGLGHTACVMSLCRCVAVQINRRLHWLGARRVVWFFPVQSIGALPSSCCARTQRLFFVQWWLSQSPGTCQTTCTEFRTNTAMVDAVHIDRVNACNADPAKRYAWTWNSAGTNTAKRDTSCVNPVLIDTASIDLDNHA